MSTTCCISMSLAGRVGAGLVRCHCHGGGALPSLTAHLIRAAGGAGSAWERGGKRQRQPALTCHAPGRGCESTTHCACWPVGALLLCPPGLCKRSLCPLPTVLPPLPTGLVPAPATQGPAVPHHRSRGVLAQGRCRCRCCVPCCIQRWPWLQCSLMPVCKRFLPSISRPFFFHLNSSPPTLAAPPLAPHRSCNTHG